MTYPTVAFQPTNAPMGVQPIAATETTAAHPLGFIVDAKDVTYGAAKFIYLKGVASTAAGDLVFYDSKAGTTVRAVHGGTGASGPAAVAMSANVANQYGWYCFAGSVPVKAGTVAANTAAYLTSTAGQIDDAVVAGDRLDGMAIKAADSGGFATCQLSSPSLSEDSAVVGTSAAMVAGTVTISTSAVAATSKIQLTHAGSTLTNAGILSVGTIVAGTSFVINSSNNADTDTVNWFIP